MSELKRYVFLYFLFTTVIHSFIYVLQLLFSWVHGVLEPVPSVYGCRFDSGCTERQQFALTHAHLPQFAVELIHLTCRFLDHGRKPEYLEQNSCSSLHGEHAKYTQKVLGRGNWTCNCLLLRGATASQCRPSPFFQFKSSHRQFWLLSISAPTFWQMQCMLLPSLLLLLDILPLALALRTASEITLEFRALSSVTSTQTLCGLENVCGLSLHPGGTRRSEATWWKLMNLARPLSPSTTSAPALSWLQEGSSRGTSSRQGAKAAQCCARLLKLGPGPSLTPALYCPQSKRLMICGSVENALERSKTLVIIATGESCSACMPACPRAGSLSKP